MPDTGGVADKGWRKGLRDLRWMLLIAAAVGVVLIILVPVYRQSPGHALASFIIAMVYGSSIGGVLTLFFNQYGERIALRRAPLNWLLVIVAIVALTAIGVLIAGMILVAVGLFEGRYYWAKFRDDMRYAWIISVVIGVSISVYESLRGKLQATTEELREKELAAAPRREGGEVRVTARHIGQHLCVEVADDGPGFARDALVAGHGLDTLHARLLALYDDRAALDIRTRDGYTVVSLSLPAVAAKQTTSI